MLLRKLGVNLHHYAASKPINLLLSYSIPFQTKEVIIVTTKPSGFGGLGVVCWPLGPKFAGSNPAEAVGFFRVKKILSTHGSKAVCPML